MPTVPQENDHTQDGVSSGQQLRIRVQSFQSFLVKDDALWTNKRDQDGKVVRDQNGELVHELVRALTEREIAQGNVRVAQQRVAQAEKAAALAALPPAERDAHAHARDIHFVSGCEGPFTIDVAGHEITLNCWAGCELKGRNVLDLVAGAAALSKTRRDLIDQVMTEHVGVCEGRVRIIRQGKRDLLLRCPACSPEAVDVLQWLDREAHKQAAAMNGAKPSTVEPEQPEEAEEKPAPEVEPTTEPNFLAIVEQARRDGLYVLPACEEASVKHPAIPWTDLQERRPTPQEEADWLKNYPRRNGVYLTGPELGRFMIDCDGSEAIEYCEKRGMPETQLVRTRRGLHYHFAYPDFHVYNSVGKFNGIYSGIDIRGFAGVAVAVGSIHESGFVYQWDPGHSPADIELAPAPDWILRWLRDQTRNKEEAERIRIEPRPFKGRVGAWARAVINGELETLRNAPNGGRNHGLARVSFKLGQLVSGGEADQHELKAAIYDIGQRWPNFERKSRSTIDRCFDAGMGHPRSAPESAWHQSHADQERYRENGGAKADEATKVEDPWPEPQPIEAALPPVLAMSPEMLPARLRAYAMDIAQRMSVPVDIVGLTLVIAMTPLIGRKVGMRPKQHDDWTVYATLWGAVVGEPGVLLKTPSMKQGLKPLDTLEREARDKVKTEGFDAEVKAARLKSAREELTKAIKAKNESDIEKLRKTFETLLAENEPRRFKVNDTTTEKLTELFQRNPNGLLLHRDELIGLLMSFEREGREGDRQYYLECWENSGDYQTDRISRGHVVAQERFLSILGTIQPDLLVRYLNELLTRGQNDGLIQRFQCLIWPDEGAWQNVDRWPEREARDEIYALFRQLENFTPNLIDAEYDRFDSEVRFLRFDAHAQLAFNLWRDILERRIRAKDEREHPLFVQHLSKYRSLLPKLSLIFHIVENLGRSERVRQIPLTTVEMAIAWCEYFESHARRAYYAVTEKALLGARSLADKIVQKQLPAVFRGRDVYRHHWRGLNSRDDALAALEILVDADWLRRDDRDRRSIEYCVNPKVLGEEVKGAENVENGKSGTHGTEFP